MWDIADEPDLTASSELLQPTETSPSEDAVAPTAGPTVWDYDAEVRARHTEIGTNVAWYAAAGPKDALIFVNQIKAATPFVPHNGSSADLVFDDNGYVAAKPEDVRVKAEVLRRSPELAGREPFTGEFRLYGRGEGRISMGDGYEANLVARTDTADLPTETIGGEVYWYVDLTYHGEEDSRGRSQSARLFVIDTAEGDHVRDLALVHHDHLDVHRSGQVFAPEFLADMDRYETLRFMDWMYANNLDLAADDSALDPEARYVGVDHFTYNNIAGGSSLKFPSSAPLEHIVALSNAVQADAWINLPADITDARARDMAAYVRDNLDDGLEIYWEYGNEIWNGAWGFDSFFYAQHMAQATFPGFDGAGTYAAVEWTAYRAPQLYEIVAEVFEAADRAARYVAPGWAHAPPVESAGGPDWQSYNYTLFEGREAQRMPDAPPRLGEIATDYAVGMYHSGVPKNAPDDLGYQLLRDYATPEAQAEALARWMLFGSNPETFHDISTAALAAPETVAWREGLNIAVSRLVRADVEAGLNPLTELDTVIRLDGAALQYRGVHAAEWTTVLRFDAAPDKTLAAMIHDVELIGESFRRDGTTNVGIKGALLSNADYRLDRHVAFVEDLGLNFVAYEGGSHLYQPRGAEMAAMFEAYEKTGWSAVVQNAWFDALERASVDLFMNYMSHDRTVGGDDYWGAQDYVGQPLSETAKGAHLLGTIAAGHAPEPEGFDPVAASGAPVLDPGLVWSVPDNWHLAADGTLTETAASNDPVTGRMLRPDSGLDSQTLRFDIGVTDDNPGRLRVVVLADGQSNVTLADWEEKITDGQHVEIALDTIPESYRDIEIIMRRTWNKNGDLTISGLALEGAETVPETERYGLLPGADMPVDSTDWAHGGNWVFDGAGGATETARSGDPMQSEFALDGLARSGLTLEMDVAAGVDSPGRLRVVVQAFGDGVTEVANFDASVMDGDRIALDLGTLPAEHDKLRIIIRRAGWQQGALTVSDLALVPPAPTRSAQTEMS
ncbi:MAG: hypothetical protein GVY28_13505 [Alphaproteobacteria bacterium]|jgi:hypothetical protein|nr:hypothetical protein [Alphaproteobacteria bacterium]